MKLTAEFADAADLEIAIARCIDAARDEISAESIADQLIRECAPPPGEHAGKILFTARLHILTRARAALKRRFGLELPPPRTAAEARAQARVLSEHAAALERYRCDRAPPPRPEDTP